MEKAATTARRRRGQEPETKDCAKGDSNRLRREIRFTRGALEQPSECNLREPDLVFLCPRRTGRRKPFERWLRLPFGKIRGRRPPRNTVAADFQRDLPNAMRLLFTDPRGCTRQPGILLDRDGVINCRISSGYVTDWSEFRFVFGIKSVLAQLSRIGFPLIVVSNQAAVGKGIISAENLAEISRRFVASLHKAGTTIDAIYYCLHRQEDACSCRKPRPGLLQKAAREWHLDLSRCVMIGDSMGDIEAARAVNCNSILLTEDGGRGSCVVPEARSRIARTPAEIPRLVFSLLGIRQKG